MKPGLPSVPSAKSFFFLTFLFCAGSAMAAKYHWVGGKGTWDVASATYWSNLSGGSPGYGPPAANDTAIFDANSFSIGGDTVFIAGNVHIGNVQWNGVNYFPVISTGLSDTLFVGTSFVLDPNMATDMKGTLVFNTVGGTHIINTFSKLLEGNIHFRGSGTRELAGGLETTGNIYLEQGIFRTKGYLLRCALFKGYGPQLYTRMLELDTSDVVIEDSWDLNNPASLSFNAGTSKILLKKPFSQAFFYGGGLNYHEVRLKSPMVDLYQANTFFRLVIDTGYITLPAGSIQNVQEMKVQGTGSQINLTSNSTGTQAQINSTSGKLLCWDNVYITDINITGAPCFSGNSTDGGNNVGINFSPCPPPVSVNVTASAPVTCNGGNDGWAVAMAMDGFPPYSFQWDDALIQTNDTASGLPAGNYNVRVIDSVNDTAWANVLINEPAILSSAPVVTNASCQGSCDGGVSLNANGGVTPYIYQWDAAAGNATTAIVNGLCTGTYGFTVTDNNGCTHTGSAVVNEPAILMANASATMASCSTSCDGSVTANPSGGVIPYTYLWSSSSTDQIITGLCAGSYTVTVTDANSCSISQIVTVTEPAAINTSFSPVTGTSCFGSCDGSATVNATGGTPSYTFQWDANAGNQNTSVAGNLCAGTYHVTVTDANGCTKVDSVLIGEPVKITVGFAKGDALCYGDCSGFAKAAPTGGVAPYTFAWDDVFNSVTDSAGNLCKGVYHVTVTDNNGCTAIDSVIIAEPTMMVLSPSSTDANCGNADGFAGVLASGGTSPYTYLWDANAANQTTNLAGNVGKGSYMVTVTDANGCKDSLSVIVNETGGPATSISKSDALCNGGCDGSATVTATGGTIPYSYQWDALAGNQTTATATNLCKGLYYVTVTDAAGCSTIDTISISEPANINIVFTDTPASCPSVCDGSATATPSGGTAPYTYLWNDPAAQTTATASNMCAGGYTVTVTDANGCASSGGRTLNASGQDPKLDGKVQYTGGGASGLQVKVLKFMTGDRMPAIDSVVTDANGNFSIPVLAAGQYILYAQTDTVMYPNTMSTFGDTAFKWESAIQITLGCGDSVTKNIKLIEIPLRSGNGRITGTIAKGGPNKRGVLPDEILGDPIPDVDVTLKSKPGNMIKGHTKTDGSGKYDFPNVEPGLYDLWVDIPGLPMDSTYELSVTASDTSFTQMDFLVDSNSIYIPPDIPTGRHGTTAEAENVDVYPNPFRSAAVLSYNLKATSEVQLTVVDLLGKHMVTLAEGAQGKGRYSYTLDALKHGMEAGIYLVRFTVDGQTSSKRIVRIE